MSFSILGSKQNMIHIFQIEKIYITKLWTHKRKLALKKFDSFENKSRLSSSSITSQRLKESTKYDIKSSEIKIIDLPYEELTENLRLKAKIEELEQNNAFLIKENKQKNDYLNLLFESGKSAQALFSENYNILKVNNKFEQISGYKNSEIGVNHYLKIFFNKKEWKRIDKLLKNLIEENQSSISRTITTKFISKNNITRSIELYFSKRQEQKQFIVCINDITEENKYEQDLIRRNKELTILNEISKSVIHPKNLDQVLKISLEKSKQLSEMEIGVVYLGKQQLKSLKSVAVIGINKEKANKIIEQNYNSIQQLKKKKKNLFLNISNNFFIDIFSKSSTCKSLVFIPLLISKNTFGILGLASKKNIEFTQEKKQLLSTIGNHLSVNIENCILFNELKEKNKTIEEKNEELSSFVCTVSHDLKTPIIALHGFLGLFTERFKKDIAQTGKDYIERVLSNAEYMEKMICGWRKFQRPRLIGMTMSLCV